MDVTVRDQALSDPTRFIDRAAQLGVTVVRGESMARHTTFRVGGPADLYAAATTVAHLTELVALARECALPVTVLGGGSNVLISDAGIRGLVIANQTRGHGFGPAYRPDWLPEPLPETRLAAESGVALAGLARAALRAGLGGLEWAVSVPGAVGGAVIGNAGAHGGDIASNLAWALILDAWGTPRLLRHDELRYGYRTSVLKASRPSAPNEAARPVVLAAAFDLAPGDPAVLSERAEAFLQRRRATQPVEPSAGSIFRNPPGGYAGQLIEAAGLKGRRIGAAQISPGHANFIVNTGAARAADVLALIRLVQETVAATAGVRLLPEILLMGDWEGEPLSFP